MGSGTGIRTLRIRPPIGKTLAYKGEFSELVRAVARMLFDAYRSRTGRHGTIAEKDRIAIRDIVKKFKNAFKDIKIDVDEADMSAQIQASTKEIFDKAVKEYLDGKAKTGQDTKATQYKKSQLDQFFMRQPAYVEAKDEFVESVKDFIRKLATGDILGGYKADEEVIDMISRLVVELYDNWRKTGEDHFLKPLEAQVDEARSQVRKMVLSLQKEHETGTEKVRKAGDRRSGSLFAAFRDTVVNNSKTYTKNVNLVRDVFIQNTKVRIRSIRNFTSKTLKKIRAPIKAIAAGIKASVEISKAFAEDAGFAKEGLKFALFAPGMRRAGLLMFAKSMKSLVGRTLRLGVFGLYGGIRILSKTVSFAFSAIAAVGKFIVNVGMKLIMGVAKIGTKVFRGVSRAFKGTVGGITRRLTGLFSFLKNNTFVKRLVRFLKTDAGAVFLGTAGAFAKVFILDPLFERFRRPQGDDEDREPPLDPNKTDFGQFLNRHQNIAEMIFGVRKMWMWIQEKFANADGLLGVLDQIFQPFKPYLSFIRQIWDMLYSAGQIAYRYKFTTIALRGMKGKGGLLLNLIAFITGFIFDLIFRSSSDHTEDKKDGSKIGLKIDENILRGAGRVRNLSDRISGIGLIRKTHAKDSDLQDITNDYLDLMDGIDAEESSIQEVDSLLDAFSATDWKNLYDKLEGPPMDNLLDMARSMELLGRHETVPGTESLPDDFRSWDKTAQINWFRQVLEFRKQLLAKIKHSLRSYGEQGFEAGDIRKYIRDLRAQNSVSALSRSNQSGIEEYKDTLRKKYSKKDLKDVRIISKMERPDVFGKDLHAQNSIQYKIARFQGLANTLASRMVTGTAAQRAKLKDIFSGSIENLSNEAMKGNDKAIDKMTELLHDMERNKLDTTYTFLSEEAERAKTSNVDTMALLSGLNLMDEAFLSGVMTIPVADWNNMRNEIRKEFMRQHGIDDDEGFDKIPEQTSQSNASKIMNTPNWGKRGVGW